MVVGQQRKILTKGVVKMQFKIGTVTRQFMSEDNGNLSTMRVLTFLIVGVVLFNWTWHNIANNVLSSFAWQDMAVVLGPLFAKAFQKGKETKKS